MPMKSWLLPFILASAFSQKSGRSGSLPRAHKRVFFGLASIDPVTSTCRLAPSLASSQRRRVTLSLRVSIMWYN